METEPLIEELNKKTNNEYKFMLKSATLDRSADFCVIEILYKDGIMLSLDKKQEFEKLIKSLLPNKYKYDIKFVKNFISEERIAKEFNEFMQKNFSSVSFELVSVRLESNLFTISIKVDTLSFEHAKQKSLENLVQNHFKTLYEEFDFKCVLVKEKVYIEDEKELLKQNFREDEPDMSEIRKIEISDTEILVGEEINEKPSYIKDKSSPESNIVLCGKIKSFKDIVIKKKPKQSQKTSEDKGDFDDSKVDETINLEKQNISNESITENQEEIIESGYEKKLFKWVLEDFTGSTNCIFFSNKENQPKLSSLANDMSIVARGNLEEDKFNGGNSFVIKDISLCKLPEKFEEKIIYKKEKPFYEFVEPEKIVTYEQNDLMSFMQEKIVPEYLRDKTFVCYDFETTGLHYEAGDKIIEIGAVKIENGKITQRFMSYVDPEKPIPADSTAVSGITDQDVAGAPKDYEVLQDFYKFTRGATIIGYNNINFDNIFLIGQGKKCRWNFSDNPTEDVYRFAQKYVHGVKNYKLGTIADALGVTLDNAHRAVYDALATAEVFVKLAEKM